MQRSRQSVRWVDGRPLRWLATACVAAGSLVIGPAMAQDPGGMRLKFGVEQRLEAGRNLGLTIPAEGSTVLSITRFSTTFSTETRNQKLSISADGAMRFGRIPGGSVSSVDEPRLRFSYTREGAREGLEVSGNYRRSRVEFLRDLIDFADEDGNITLPEDFEDLIGTGQRTDRSLRGKLELGRDLPLGLILEGRHSATTYSGTTNPDLNDTRRDGLDTTVRMELSPVATARLRVGRERFRAEDAAQTRRVSDRVELGLVYDISPVLQVDAGLGWQHINTREFGAFTRQQGLSGRMGIRIDRPDGRFDLRFAADRDQAGLRQTLRFDRVFERPDGAISAGIGLTRNTAGSTDVIGDLAWRRDLPDAQITARLARSVQTTNDDEARLRTVAALGWQHEINAVSGLAMRLDHSRSAATVTQNRLDRTDLSATYSHLLTADWALNLGARYGVRHEQGVGRSNAPQVFMSLGRQFHVRF